MTLTDRPLSPDEVDQPRLIVAVVTTTFRYSRPTTVDRVTMSCHSDDLDPEFRQNLLWFALMLDDDPAGPGIRDTWRHYHDDDVHPDVVNVTVMVDGEYILDECGYHALSCIEYAIAKAERAIVNP